MGLATKWRLATVLLAIMSAYYVALTQWTDMTNSLPPVEEKEGIHVPIHRGGGPEGCLSFADGHYHVQIQVEYGICSIGEEGPQSSMYITWNTKTQTDQAPMVIFREENEHQSIGLSGKSTKMDLDDNLQYVHRVHLGGLKSNRRYMYKVGNGDKYSWSWSREKSFKTLPASTTAKNLSIIVYGDFGFENAVSLSRIRQEVEGDSVNLIIHAGDIAYKLHTVGDQFMNMLEPITCKVPYHVCPGNHDRWNNFAQLKARFTMPGEGRKSKSMWHSFDFGNIHFCLVDSEVWVAKNIVEYWYKRRDLVAQLKWLKHDLKEANKPARRKTQPFVAVVAHQPMYCSDHTRSAKGCEKKNSPIRVGLKKSDSLERIMYEYGVDFYISGHVHSYSRTHPIFDYKFDLNNTGVYANVSKPIHVIVGAPGAGGGTNRWRGKKEWSASQSSEYGYGKLETLSHNKMKWSYISADSADVLDSAIIDKS